MRITSAKSETRGGHDHVSAWIDGKLAGVLVVGEGEASQLLVELLGPVWLLKDFNVLYRTVHALLMTLEESNESKVAHALNEAARQLERLRSAYELTETFRALPR